MNASSILIFLVVVAISANLIAARSKKKKANEKAINHVLKHRIKTKKNDTLNLQDQTEHYWTLCKPEYANPAGVCMSGYHLTKNPKHGNKATWAKEIDGLSDNDGTYRCKDRPQYRLRYFCAKTFTKSFWAGTAPWCGSKDEQVSDCESQGYVGLTLWTSEFGDGRECTLRGKKVLCAKV